MIEEAVPPVPLPQSHRKEAHPGWFAILILPYGVIQGYLTVTLAYFYRNAGMSVEQIAGLVGLILIPNIFKFLWGPLVDLTFTVKKWHMGSTVLIALGVVLLGLVPAKVSSIPLLSVIIFIASVAVSFEGLAVSSLMAYDTPPEKMGLAGGYYNTGSIGGIGIGGGGALFIYQFINSQVIVAVIVAVFCICCCFALLFVNQPQRTPGIEKAATKMLTLLKDLWHVLKVRAGILGLFLSLLPFGTGAAGSLFAAMAKDWHASVGAVALATGFWSGIITAVGCFIAGFICDRINRQLCYVLFGVFQAICALGMAFCPHNQAYYIFWTLAYSFANGFAYAAFSAFVLEVIGKTAAATKYNTYAGISNIPIYTMVIVDGWANTHWGSTGTLVIEAICAGIGAVLFFGVKALIGLRKTSVTATREPITEP